MIALLVIIVIGLITYGYLLMRRLDKFIGGDGFTNESEVTPVKELLLFGERETVEKVSAILNEASVDYDIAAEPMIKEGAVYRWISALSQDDTDNLLICLSAKRKNSGVRTMARCNNKIYENTFKQTGITIIIENDISTAKILDYLKG